MTPTPVPDSNHGPSRVHSFDQPVPPILPGWSTRQCTPTAIYLNNLFRSLALEHVGLEYNPRPNRPGQSMRRATGDWGDLDSRRVHFWIRAEASDRRVGSFRRAQQELDHHRQLYLSKIDRFEQNIESTQVQGHLE